MSIARLGKKQPHTSSQLVATRNSEQWATLYAAAQEVDFDQLLWDESKAVFWDTGGSSRETLFLLCADGKVLFFMANYQNWEAEEIYRRIAANRRILDYGLHGVLRVTTRGILGTRHTVAAATTTANARLLLCIICFSPSWMLPAFKRRR